MEKITPMKKNTVILLLAILACSPTTFGQTSQDSIDIVSIKWDTQKIRKGVVWKSAETVLYDSPQAINILEIKPGRKNRLAIGYCLDTRIATSQLCQQADATAGVNASFFDVKNGNSVDYMKVDGKVIHQGREILGNSNSAITIDGKKVAIIRLDKGNAEARALNHSNILVAGPMLVSSSAIADLTENSFNKTRHPRTCAAITNKGTILLVTVDGRHAGNAEGMSTKELAFLLKILGAKDAMNFDGGGSTAMYIKGHGENGIVNYPSDNKTFDHKGERKVANVVYLK